MVAAGTYGRATPSTWNGSSGHSHFLRKSPCTFSLRGVLCPTTRFDCRAASLGNCPVREMNVASQSLRTVDRAMQSLLVIAEHAPITVGELARLLDVPVSTTYRHVAALRKH